MRKKIIKSANVFLLLYYIVNCTKRRFMEDAHRQSHNSKLKQKIGAKCPKSLVFLNSLNSIYVCLRSRKILISSLADEGGENTS